MRTRRLGLLLALAGALFWLGQGTWAAPGTGAPAGAPAFDTAARTAAAGAVTTTAAATATETPAPAPEGESGTLIPSRPVLGATLAAAAQGQGKAKGQVTRDEVFVKKFQRVAPSEVKAAAARAAALGMKPGLAGRTDLVAAAITPADLPPGEGPGGVPHYFGPYGNWGFSPLPSFGVMTDVTVDTPGSGYAHPIVTITDVYGTGTATAAATLTADGLGGIASITVSASSGFHVPFVTVVDDPTQCGGELQPACGTGATATAAIDLATLTGGMRKFVDSVPGVGAGQANNLGQYIPIGQKQGWPLGCDAVGSTTPCTADYYEIGLVEYTEQMHSDLPGPHNPATPGALGTRLRGYVQLSTTGTGTALFNPDGTPILLPNGSQAYGVTPPHYLGPLIVAKGRVHGIEAANPADGAPVPVRIKFYNLLPTGSGGNLFIPVDESVPGSGYGPAVLGSAGDKYTQNRATVHLHGNNTVWLSDGNVHQWITPASEVTPYPAGVSARSVPDMNGCDAGGVDGNNVYPGNSGCMTMYYTNAQSARLQFYHDHAHGITRLNVYAGEAAGYLVTDAVEQDMAAGTNVTGVNPGLLKVLPPDNGGLGIPLVIQDKTFVDATTIWGQDPTWNSGTGPRDPVTGNVTGAVTGDLWYPHVYMSVQNPWDLTGTNGYGRWHYGPWFNPPTPICVNGGPVGCVENGPVPNEYYQPDPALPNYAPWEPPMRPGMPNPSMPGESFLDTPLVNGTAYPYMEVEPRAYRFRVLNAANDRFWNLQLYVAADNATPTTPGTSGTVLCDGSSGVPVGRCTEVKMVPVGDSPANQYADTPSGIPDSSTAGPPWIQIGTEGGFMPEPIVIPQQPIGYNLDPAYFAYGIVNQHSLWLGAAERADVIVDFSQYVGKTLILYNDSPAPVPAGAAPYDNYTGDGDGVDGGGAPNTQPGYGPNTRTIMQIRVTRPLVTDTTQVTLDNLKAVFAKTAGKRGVFEVSQDPVIVPQAIYNSAYDLTFPSDAASQYALNMSETQKTFNPVGGDNTTGTWSIQPPVTIPFEMKAMHDEMGGVYDTMYGRMSGMLGLTNPLSNVHVLIPYGYSSPPTDVVKGSLEFTPIGQLADGTQIWRIFHNGVDTHPIHTHLFHAQLINRMGQDGQVTPGPFPVGEPVDAADRGWKDTFKVNPLEMTFLALRPTVPTPTQVPFEVPDSVRLIDPILPEGATLPPPAPAGWFDPQGNPIPELLNHYVNFGWEYVWHCHILSHEEMDFMHSLPYAVPPRPATNLTAAWNANANNPRINLNWTDTSIKEVGFTIQRATDQTFTKDATIVATVGPLAGTGATGTYLDTTVARNSTYYYRVWANGQVVGDVGTPGFPTLSADSLSNTAGPIATFSTAPLTPAAPTNLTAAPAAGPLMTVSWVDNASNETGFVLERCAAAAGATTCSTAYAQVATLGPSNNTGRTVTYPDTTVAYNSSYLYRVSAYNGSGSSAWATLPTAVTVPALPPAPTSFTVLVSATRVGNRYPATLTWVAAVDPASFTIERANNLDFTTGLTTIPVAGNVRTYADLLNRNTVYYYRIRANNSIGGSSTWTNAVPFPVRTGR